MPDEIGSNLQIHLGDLKDVERGAPEDGDVILFDAASGKWMPGSAGGGASAPSSIWVPGSAFTGNASGFGSPGGSGEMAAFTFASGQNSYGIVSVIVPSEWTSFEFDLYASSADASLTNRYLFEGNWGLFGEGDTLDGDLNAFVTDLTNQGAGALAIQTGVQGIDNPDGKSLFQLKLRSNNATQEISGAIWLLGVLLHTVS